MMADPPADTRDSVAHVPRRHRPHKPTQPDLLPLGYGWPDLNALSDVGPRQAARQPARIVNSAIEVDRDHEISGNEGGPRSRDTRQSMWPSNKPTIPRPPARRIGACHGEPFQASIEPQGATSRAGPG